MPRRLWRPPKRAGTVISLHHDARYRRSPHAGAIFEAIKPLGATADRCNHRTRDDRADARYSHDPSTTAITLCQGLDLVGHDFNSFIELPPVTGKIGNDAYHAW